MPLIAIIVLAVIAVGLVAAVVTPLIVGDPIHPPTPAPTEITAPADPGRVEVPYDNRVDNFNVDPVEIYEAHEEASPVDDSGAGFDDEAGFNGDVTPTNVDGAVNGAANSIPEF